MSERTPVQAVRIDKWLWAARFFKTRNLAKTAIEGGKVQVNGQRVKPSKDIALNMLLTIRQGFEEKTVLITGLSEQRGPAAVAATLYEETADSLQKRLLQQEQRKLQQAAAPYLEGRPNKKQRRQIHQFILQQSDSD
ncbi:MAG TPA: ribosome-associated heat shock protein Hsp15 [Cellvibrionaceae bacterium]